MKQCLRSEIQIVQRESKDLMLVLEKYFGKKMSIFLRRGRIMVGNDPLLQQRLALGGYSCRVSFGQAYYYPGGQTGIMSSS